MQESVTPIRLRPADQGGIRTTILDDMPECSGQCSEQLRYSENARASFSLFRGFKPLYQ